jgi:type-F conjugative transfer system pilin assembly protein TrbC
MKLKDLYTACLLTAGTFAVSLALGAAASAAHAQTPKPGQMPTDAEIAAKQKATLEALNGMNVSKEQIRSQMNSTGVAAGAAAAISGANPGSQVRMEDFTRLSRPGAAQQAAKTTKEVPADLMIFVSLSMPANMLEQYAAQAKRFGATLIMRGFVNDRLSDTKVALQRLNKAGAAWQISPEPFIHFKIDKVPAIVVATAESASITEEGCAAPETFTAVFGDMSVHAALDHMSLRATKPIAEMAKARLVADRNSAR